MVEEKMDIILSSSPDFPNTLVEWFNQFNQHHSEKRPSQLEHRAATGWRVERGGDVACLTVGAIARGEGTGLGSAATGRLRRGVIGRGGARGGPRRSGPSEGHGRIDGRSGGEPVGQGNGGTHLTMPCGWVGWGGGGAGALSMVTTEPEQLPEMREVVSGRPLKGTATEDDDKICDAAAPQRFENSQPTELLGVQLIFVGVGVSGGRKR
uniref:Uncharacterized protein n=1 Tax=Oryza punctata TaxID=4537 RepID=A0A0E0K345_ORYPU